VIGVPPFDEGGLKVTVARPSPGTAVTPVGEPGGALGVTDPEGADAGPAPAALVAATANV
jgi:hypothetical protein